MTTSTRTTVIHFLLFLCLLPGCKAQNPPTINGRIHITQEWKSRIYLILPRHFREIAADYQGQVLDSADIAADGTFYFEATRLPRDRSILLIALQQVESRFANHLMDENPAYANYMPLIYTPGEAIRIEANARAFHSTCHFFNISEDNQALINLRNLRIDAFEKYNLATSEMEDDSLIIEKEKAHLDYITPLMHFADTTTSAEAALIAIRWISPTNDFERIPEFIYHQCDRLESAIRPTHLTAEVCAMADPRHLSIRIGDMMPDFPLPMFNGDTVSLHSLLGEQFTIVDLWASWCAPCRNENRNVLFPIWSQYHTSGVEIIGYALDDEFNEWKLAIQKDNATWSHASHLSGDVSPFLDALRISTIPANYILDPKGKILARNLHGAELEVWIRQKAYQK